MKDDKDLRFKPEFGTNVVKITICKTCPVATAREFVSGLESIKCTQFQYDLINNVDMETPDNQRHENTPIQASPGNKLLVVIKAIEKLMRDLNYSLFRGEMFRKVPEGKYSFTRCCSVAEFVHASLTNGKIADILAAQVTNVINILSHPGCQIIRQLKFNYNLIEVKPTGVCFDIAAKKFVANPISDNAIGQESPRAFVSYTYREGHVPNPKIFIEGIENSFPDADKRMHFYRKYYQLLCHRRFPFKTKKLCLVGDPNSGKTSWFAPFQGIIPVKAIASVTREKQFAAYTINEETQVVFIDEWSSDSMCAEDAKRVLQGGLQILPQKHKEASICIYQSGFFITTNEMPNFGQGLDAEAISTRLAVFQTEPLKSVRRSCTRWMRKAACQYSITVLMF